MRKEFRWVNPHHLHCYTFNWQKAFKYAKLMEQGVKFPPVRVWIDGAGKYVVRNGAHRSAAAKMLGVEILIEVHFFNESEEDYINGYRIR